VTLVEAIALGGGFKDSARRTQVVLLRKSSSDMAEVKVFDLRKLMSPAGILEDQPIRAGDMLVVPRNTISKIEPYVHLSDAGLYGLAAKFL
jgi:protein involved in polysaccharide export with SLBB domain